MVRSSGKREILMNDSSAKMLLSSFQSVSELAEEDEVINHSQSLKEEEHD